MSLALPARYLAVFVMMSCLDMFGGRAEACMVCIPFPENTATDYLLQADVVVLARENAKKPFSYITVKVLKGILDDPAIDLFIDSSTRRRLANNPDHSVVLTFSNATNNWRFTGYANPAYKALVGEILAHEPTWKQSEGAESRATFFVPYLGNADTSVSKLAYLEVGRASYDVIRQADSFVTAEQVHRFLDNPQYIEWFPLYILLLGVDAKPAEEKRIRATMARRAQFDQTLNLSAWATALIEIDGEEAIDWLEAVYLGKPGRDPDTVLEIVKALSVHGARDRSGQQRRRRIAESYGLLIQSYPSLAGWAARDFTAWGDWRFVELLTELRKSRSAIDSATAYSIDYYIGRAQSKVSN